MSAAHTVATVALLLLGGGVALAIAGVVLPALFYPGVFVTMAGLLGMVIGGAMLVLQPKSR